MSRNRNLSASVRRTSRVWHGIGITLPLMSLVAGIDSSTQSVKITVHDADTGVLVREATAPHPDGTECPPERWWEAMTDASTGLLDGVRAISVAGQQHGLVTLDASEASVRPALLWNDTRSAQAASDLVAELGASGWAQAVGSVPVASFTVTKLRWLAQHEPDSAARVESVLLPHDYLTWRLCGHKVTDRGDASGTGYWSPRSGEYRHDLVKLAFGRALALPEVLDPQGLAGETSTGVLVAAGTGDNMGAALGLGLEPGDVVVSLGTSGTAFAVTEAPTADPSGDVAGFADATGRFLPLVCTLNASRVITSTASLLGVDLAEFGRLAQAAPAGAAGLVLLPYLDGERTPNLPGATGSLHGITRTNLTPECLARAAVEGMLCGLADGVDALRRVGVTPRRVLLVGGAAANEAVRAISATVFDVPIAVPAAGQYVARGAARQAAWALADGAVPDWPVPLSAQAPPEPEPAVREAFAAARDSLYG